MTRDQAIALANTKFAEHHPEWCSETPEICECTIAAILEAADGAQRVENLRSVEYRCGCNITPFCPFHGEPFVTAKPSAEG